MRCLPAGSAGELPKRLARLELTRQQLAARMTEIDDYMNWFEATQMNSGSGNFTGYLEDGGSIASFPGSRRRRDPALSLRSMHWRTSLETESKNRIGDEGGFLVGVCSVRD